MTVHPNICLVIVGDSFPRYQQVGVSLKKFLEPARNIFDNLKVRASYGSLGNQVTDGNFQYLSFLTSESLAYLMNGGIISGLKAPTLASTNITWEKVYTTNIGLDWTMLNGRFTGSFDYYIRDTKGMVVNKTYPAVLGTTGGKENLADMRTKGMELSLTWNDQIKTWPAVFGLLYQHRHLRQHF